MPAVGNLRTSLAALAMGTIIGGVLVTGLAAPTAGATTKKPNPVEVVNFPNPQNVAGTVQVSNLPTSQVVSGTVSVDNLPTVQSVAGSIQVSNFPPSQVVSGTVNVGNLPAVQTVAGETSVSNLPVDGQGNLRVAGITDLNAKLNTLIAGSGHRFVGVTAATTAGNTGWKGMSDMCRSEFGTSFPGVHLCLSQEILRTDPAAWPAVPLDHPAWVQPVIQVVAWPLPQMPLQTVLMTIDVSGAYSSNAAGVADTLSCAGWSSADSFRGGLIVGINGGFNVNQCSDSLGVACCAP